MRDGLVGRLDLPDDVLAERRTRARAEAQHLIRLMEEEPIGIQIGVVPGALPHSSFQIFRQADRKIPDAQPLPRENSPISMVALL